MRQSHRQDADGFDETVCWPVELFREPEKVIAGVAGGQSGWQNENPFAVAKLNRG